MGCSALLVYFIMGSLMQEQGMESGVRSTGPCVPQHRLGVKTLQLSLPRAGDSERMCECREGAECQAQEYLPE